MPTQVDQQRLAEVFRLKVAGLSDEEISRELTSRAIMKFPADPAQVARDIAAINRIMDEYGDAEKARMAIALDLDRLFAMILEDLSMDFKWEKRVGARPEFYKQATQMLMQKALLYGLNSENVTVNQRNTRLVMLVQQLRQLDATKLDSEGDYLPEPQSDPLSLASAAPEGLLVESDSSDRWGARREDAYRES
jgi:hypothetical protein